MTNQINPSEIQSFIKDEKIVPSFIKFQNKNPSSKLLLLKNKAVFLGALNKNKYYDVMVHILNENNINQTLIEIKKHFDDSILLIYLRNKNNAKLFSKINSNLLIRKMNWFYLSENTLLSKINLSSDFMLKKYEVNKKLEDFFIDCFKEEWDENVKKWFTAYSDYEGQKEILVLEKQNKIAAAIMYWVNDKNIYIFLLGTNSKFRRNKLANYLIKQVQKNYPKLEMNLTVYSDADAVHFYKKLGFVEAGISGVCV